MPDISSTSSREIERLFDNIMRGYEAHNWLTVDGFDAAFSADGLDAVLTDFGLGDLIG